jgi:CBS domain-containing protein
VGEALTHTPLAVTSATTLREAAGLLLAPTIGGLPIVGAARRLVGIITESDLCGVLLTRE